MKLASAWSGPFTAVISFKDSSKHSSASASLPAPNHKTSSQPTRQTICSSDYAFKTGSHWRLCYQASLPGNQSVGNRCMHICRQSMYVLCRMPICTSSAKQSRQSLSLPASCLQGPSNNNLTAAHTFQRSFALVNPDHSTARQTPSTDIKRYTSQLSMITATSK